MQGGPALESELQDQVLRLLARLKLLGLLDYTRVTVCGIPIEPKRDAVCGGWNCRAIATNKGMEGFSDIEVVANGRVGYLELKAGRGKLSEPQIAFRESRTKHGAKFAEPRSLSDVINFLRRDMGVPF